VAKAFISSGALATLSWEDANLANLITITTVGPPIASVTPITGKQAATYALASTNTVSVLLNDILVLGSRELRRVSLLAKAAPAGAILRFGLVDANAVSFATAVRGVVFEIDGSGIEAFEGNGTTMVSKGTLATPVLTNDDMVHELLAFHAFNRVSITAVIGGEPVALGGNTPVQALKVLVEVTGGSGGGNVTLGPVTIDRNTQNVEG
jgi:hypothetical protein